jgi:hypothetical protein
MFVSVIYDCADEDHKEAVRRDIEDIWIHGKDQDTFETATISESSLLRLNASWTRR